MDDDLEGLSHEEKEALLLDCFHSMSKEEQDATLRMAQYLIALPDEIVPTKEEMAELFKQFKHPN